MQPTKSYAEIFQSINFRPLGPSDYVFNGNDNQSLAWLAIHNSANDVQNYVEPVIRLYQAAFNRVPEASGLNFWVNAYRSGAVSLDQIAAGFTASSEFQATYGPPSGARDALLTGLYHNVLGREPDAAGQTFWLGSGVGADKMLVGFAQSSEFINKTTPYAEEFLISSAEGTQSHTGSLFAPQLYSILSTGEIQIPAFTEFTLRAEFNTQVTGLDIGDFVVTTHSGNATGTISSMSQSGSGLFPNNWTIFFDVKGSGTISLDLKPNAGVHDAAGHDVALTGLPGEILTV